jgi:1,2-phenylacetyl-CoA epoxidase catalytic subunit
MRRLAEGPETRGRVADALGRLWRDADAVFTPLAGEAILVTASILPEGMAVMRTRWHERVEAELAALGLAVPAADASPSAEGRTTRTDDFRWLWGEFTSVARAEPGATW